MSTVIATQPSPFITSPAFIGAALSGRCPHPSPQASIATVTATSWTVRA